MSDASDTYSDDIDDYYNLSDTDDPVHDKDEKKDDPEYFQYEEMIPSALSKLLQQAVNNLSASLKLHVSACEMLLVSYGWNENGIKRLCESDYVKALAHARIIPPIQDESRSNNNHSAVPANISWPISSVVLTQSKEGSVCACCYLEPSVSSHWSAFPHSPAASSRPALGRGDEFLQLYSLLCAEHYFCLPCWRQYLHHQLNDGGSFTRNYRVIAYECMGHQCHVRIPPSFAQWILQDTWLDCDAVLTSSTTVQCQQQQQQQPSSFTTSDLTTTTAAAASAVSSVEVLSCREKYESLLLRDLVVSHPHLRSCPTSRCSSVFRAIAPLVSKRDIWPDPCHDPNDSNTIFRTIAPLVLRRDIYSDPCHDPTDSGTSISHSPVDVVMTSKSASGGGGGASQSTRLFSSLRVTCRMCDSESCFLCGGEYHAPTDCDTLIQWTKKCLDDSETANYISAHTKDCPRCHVCIEKSGGCNHMNCTKCGYNFCWMCLGDWKTHSAEYYECSRYRENPNVANEAQHIMARKALKKYIFYYERWANHEKSLRLEHEQSERIRQRINLKVNNKEGTWIDWQYLLTASETLRRCRNTLKHTYPFAFYMDRGPHKHRKELFEYKQGLLEAEVENLSWKIEHAEISDRGGLEQKMDICEKHRKALLHEFFMP